MADIKFKPLGDYLLVKPEEAETKTKSGIVLTESSTETPKRGKVVAVGNGYFDVMTKQFMPLTVKANDNVYWSGGYGVNEITIDGEKYLVLKESQILGIAE
jgi:chaperonin GroES